MKSINYALYTILKPRITITDLRTKIMTVSSPRSRNRNSDGHSEKVIGNERDWEKERGL